MSLNTDIWIAELERLNNKQPDGFSCRELMDEKGWNKDKSLVFIRKAVECGILVYSGDRKIVNVANRVTWTPVYKLVQK